MTRAEKRIDKKRGCRYCLDYKKKSGCKHAECPYHELDGINTYEEYYQSRREIANLGDLFSDL
jgi:hypothetical protein